MEKHSYVPTSLSRYCEAVTKWLLVPLMLLPLCGCVIAPDFPEVEPGFKTRSERSQGVQWVEPAEQTKDTTRPLLVMIHGTPGDWSGFRWYLADNRLQYHFRVLAVDRPGFGGSGDSVMPSLEQQAQVLLDSLPASGPVHVVGHSLGGPIALWMALLAPERVTAVTLIAGSVAPELEQPRWFNVWADTWIAHKVLPGVLLRSNAEVMALQGELTKLMPELAAMRTPILSIQGRDDELVNPHSPDALLRWLPADATVTDLRVENEGHFILWDRPEFVRDAILDFQQQHPRPSA